MRKKYGSTTLFMKINNNKIRIIKRYHMGEIAF